MWERLSLAVKILSCYLNAGLGTANPLPLKICEILLLNVDPTILQEMRMYALIKVKDF